MLAVAVTHLPSAPGWTFEPKWDGYRGIGAVGDGQLRIAGTAWCFVPQVGCGDVPAPRWRLAADGPGCSHNDTRVGCIA
jgi:hypothetical protein